MNDTATPDYDPLQSSFHEAFRGDLYRVLDALPLPSPASVLDVPCGGGFYSARLAEQLRPGDRLLAVDACDAYLEETRGRLAEVNSSGTTEVEKADAYHLPYADHSFDLVLCAQSLISLDPEPAVRELFRVTKPDGLTVILESDEFHHVMLPWPVELEAAIPAAIRAASLRKYGRGDKLAPARRLRPVLKRAGFKDVRRVTVASDRAAPFDPHTQRFLVHHLASLKELVFADLPPAQQRLFEKYTDPDDPASLFRTEDAELVCLNAVYLAQPAAVPRTGSAKPPARKNAHPLP